MNRLHPQQVHHHPGHGGHHHHPGGHHPGHPIGYNKDDIYNWFRTLNNWNRIDLMCGLLDLCHPFEVKYLQPVSKMMKPKMILIMLLHSLVIAKTKRSSIILGLGLQS